MKYEFRDGRHCLVMVEAERKALVEILSDAKGDLEECAELNDTEYPAEARRQRDIVYVATKAIEALKKGQPK